MSKQDNGGAAFPVLHNDAGRILIAENGGMTLRDYFAAKAMQTGLQGARLPGADQVPAPKEVQDAVFSLARVSYVVADAMLKARQS